MEHHSSGKFFPVVWHLLLRLSQKIVENTDFEVQGSEAGSAV